MNQFADLHIHTHFSDSTSSPQTVVEQAVEIGLSCIAVTDHDVVDGIRPTQMAAEKYDLEVIGGIELSSEWENREVHMLGYFLDIENEVLSSTLRQMQEFRVERIHAMIAKLKDLGVDDVESEEVFRLSQSMSVGRMHLATVLVKKGWVRNHYEAFHKYIGEDGPAYVGKFELTPYQAIELIHEARGIAVLAHPMVTNKDEIISSLVDAGLQGLEVYYPNIPSAVVDYYEGLARKYHLVMTGGSDAHGDVRMNTFVGKAKVPYENVLALKNLLSDD